MAEFIDKIKAEATDDFCGTDFFDNLDVKNIRLRQYDPKLKVKQIVYDDLGKTIVDYNLHSYYELKIETNDTSKEAHVEFTDFDPGIIYLRPWLYENFLKTIQTGDDDDQVILDYMMLEREKCGLVAVNIEKDSVSDL